MKELLLDTALTMSRQRNNKISSHRVTVQLGGPTGELMLGLPVVKLVVLGLVFISISKQMEHYRDNYK